MTLLGRPAPLEASVRVTPIAIPAPPGALLEALAAESDPVLLDSSALHGDFGRYSVLTCRPLEVLTLAGDVLRDRSGAVLWDVRRHGRDELWRQLGRALGAVRAPRPQPDCGYVPGWFGYVGYEVGRYVERLPGRARRDVDLPDLRLAFCDAALVYDARERTWQLAELQFADRPRGAGEAGEALRAIAGRAAGASSNRPAAGAASTLPAASADADTAPAPTEHADARVRPAAAADGNFAPDAYRRAVARCVEYIAAGDIFQVNLSQRFTVSGVPSPIAVYRTLRSRNPAWYAAYLHHGPSERRTAILSSSPELFLRVRSRRVLTRPIKGTRPRVGDAARDRAAADDLLASPKDNAELAMIIDLLRNDLGRVCEYGSVRVAEPCRLETHPTVFHLVGTVEGVLRDGVGPAELLRATFPGGSITGAPKVRSMEIIDELEPTARGVYTGSIGTVGVDGSCEWNIAIRTMLWQGGRAHVQVGGGIVADSSPEGEYQETLDKARAMLEAIQQARDEDGNPPAW